ncbi:hypothetical protein P691DRAFT_402246 [Macrolepiota fuliginosa MF-IS2]|uniref:F-box domain-containing protein n=1 Tax=Macrolepiota fuliginosa MF-IS2 TaxID=1400762 RepID=A0A9P5X594_9AGAR|nr:hypothetical protein P691DRAFT_402246 [Macrolepiota fuliginosa MF-IS2]
MSLLYNLLRSNSLQADSDDDLVNVTSTATSPSHTRPSSPTYKGAAARPLPKPLHLKSTRSPTDPLRVLPTEISQRIFSRLSLRDLAKCSLVSKKWNRSQTLNYVWFQLYRRENFHDDSLPPGKWTKRESKQNWRVIHLKTIRDRSPPSTPFSRSSSAYNSGYQTPREIREEQWRITADTSAKPNKLEMREMYKELGGRKARSKAKLGSSGPNRDKGGWGDGEDW